VPASLFNYLIDSVLFAGPYFAFFAGLYFLSITFGFFKPSLRGYSLNGPFFRVFFLGFGVLCFHHAYVSLHLSLVQDAKNKLEIIGIIKNEDYALNLVGDNTEVSQLIRKSGFNLDSQVGNLDAASYLFKENRFDSSKLVDLTPKNFPNNIRKKVNLDSLCGFKSNLVCTKLFDKSFDTAYKSAIYMGAISGVKELRLIAQPSLETNQQIDLIKNELIRINYQFDQIRISFNSCMANMSPTQKNLCGQPIKELIIYDSSDAIYEYESFDDCIRITGEKDFRQQCNYIRGFGFEKNIKSKNLVAAATIYLQNNMIQSYSDLQYDLNQLKSIIKIIN
jgi:hypothetical protein